MEFRRGPGSSLYLQMVGVWGLGFERPGEATTSVCRFQGRDASPISAVALVTRAPLVQIIDVAVADVTAQSDWHSSTLFAAGFV